MYALTGSSPFSARRMPRFLYFPIGKSAPTVLFFGPPFFACRGIGTHDFASLMVDHWALESPRLDGQSTLTFLYPVGTSALSRFRYSRDRNFGLLTPDTRCAETPTRTCEWTLPPPITSIGISGFTGSRILMSMILGLTFPRTLIRRATYPPLTSCGPHTTL
jgi:hypothetical protein